MFEALRDRERSRALAQSMVNRTRQFYVIVDAAMLRTDDTAYQSVSRPIDSPSNMHLLLGPMRCEPCLASHFAGK